MKNRTTSAWPSPITLLPALMLLALLFPVRAGTQEGKTAEALNLPPIAEGPYKPTWKSLESQYTCPEWFRDAKFGIWAHWGAQCEPELGDWYAKNMYLGNVKNKKTGKSAPSSAYLFHKEHYGPQSQFGFKDVIHQWKAADFDPDKLLAFYKENGAKYFMALAVHCDNFDNYNSKYQPWNSVNMGPKKDLIGGWAAAAKKNGLRFGVSVHNGGWTWRWYEPSQGADESGPYKGIPYDGKLTKADGKGTWWEGYDPQDLYAQNHALGAPPDAAYCQKYFLRVRQLWDDYQPDMIYFDEMQLPMHYMNVDDAYGLNLYAHLYNSNIRKNGTNEAVINSKILTPEQRKGVVYDLERGRANGIMPEPWQTDTCLGAWHYDKGLFDRHGYKKSGTVLQLLADIVSKNGNLMLSVPLQRNGQPDADEIKIVEEIGAWLKTNGEAIYATRPWLIYGEGPSTVTADHGKTFDPAALTDVAAKPFTSEDIRFTQSKDHKVLYAIAMAWPKDGKLLVKSLATSAGKINEVSLLGYPGKLDWQQTPGGLAITLPKDMPAEAACSFRILGEDLKPAVEAAVTK